MPLCFSIEKRTGSSVLSFGSNADFRSQHQDLELDQRWDGPSVKWNGLASSSRTDGTITTFVDAHAMDSMCFKDAWTRLHLSSSPSRRYFRFGPQDFANLKDKVRSFCLSGRVLRVCNLDRFLTSTLSFTQVCHGRYLKLSSSLFITKILSVRPQDSANLKDKVRSSCFSGCVLPVCNFDRFLTSTLSLPHQVHRLSSMSDMSFRFWCRQSTWDSKHPSSRLASTTTPASQQRERELAERILTPKPLSAILVLFLVIDQDLATETVPSISLLLILVETLIFPLTQ